MGLLHIYCGEGKGKTSAALGLAMRAAGAEMKVCFVQLMKGCDTSELYSLKYVPNIIVKRCDRNYGFYRNMSESDRESITDCHNELIKNAFSGEFDVVILDEFCSAYNFELMNRNFAEQQIFSSLSNTEIVLTGRDPAEIFLKSADYISSIECRKHPYKKGICARRGIEY